MTKEYVFQDEKKYPIYNEFNTRSSLAAVGYESEDGFKVVKEVIRNRYTKLKVPIIIY